MSTSFATIIREGARGCAQAILTLGFWSLWLALTILLTAQLYIAWTNELEVPSFVRRALEKRLAISGIHIVFAGKTRFDPSGRILAQDVRITLPGFEETLVTARAIYARLDPWALAANRFEPLELKVTGVSLRVPAMLSPSGKADEVVRDLDGDFVPRGDELVIEYLSYHLGKLAVSIRGSVHLGSFQGRKEAPLPVAEFLAHDYPGLSRTAAAVTASFDVFDRPMLSARLTPSQEGGAVVDATLLAESVRFEHPFPLRARQVSVRAKTSLLGRQPDGFGIVIAAERLELSRWGAIGHGFRGWLQLRLKPDLIATSASLSFVGGEIRAYAADFAAAGLSVENPLLWADLSSPDPAGRRLRAELRGLVWSQAVSTQVQVDPDRRLGQIRFRGGVSPAVLGFIQQRWHRDLGRWVAFTAPVELEGAADLGPGWAFLHAAGKVAATDLTVKNVHLDEVRGRFEFDGRHLIAPEAFVCLGEDFARGRYEEDLTTLDYRFLLEGQLRPLKITPWIAGNWWREFFGNFAFPADPPALNFDMKSCWSNGRKAAVFVSADCRQPVIRGVDFDRIRTRLFIRPQFVDGLAFKVVHGSASAGGTFARLIDLGAGGWRSLDFDIASTLGLDQVKKIMGTASTPAALALFASEKPPTVKIRGHLDGPAAAGGPHQTMHLEANAGGVFRYRDFPLQGASFTAEVRDDDIDLDRIRAGFAGGTLTGHAHLAGRGPQRRLVFDSRLSDASLGGAISTVNAYTAQRAHRRAPSAGDFVKEKASVRLDLDLSAEGRFDDPLSFQGSGSANLSGAGLGEVRMLGLLSALLRFTSLRFTTAHASFNLDGQQLVFSDVTVTGANSAIAAHGTYGLDQHQLDFRATVSPFKESKSLPQKFMDVMLTPLSDALAVRLVGTIEKPKWTFVNGPTNFLRNLEPDSPPPSPLKIRAAPADY